MSMPYKVGRTTDFGKLLAEAVKYDNPNYVVSFFETTDESDEGAYMVIIWDISNEFGEFEVSRTYQATHEDAGFMFLSQAFNVTM